ncbi:hypothetical protein J32TS6_27630 [Virgibacillus pantothenticus]|nr:hypothetical protein J32TS6_27630 [Virgibacillus pantothenticus]
MYIEYLELPLTYMFIRQATTNSFYLSIKRGQQLLFRLLVNGKATQVLVVNPAHVKKSKELDDNSPTKNDVKDARVISRLIQDGRYLNLIYQMGSMQSSAKA